MTLTPPLYLFEHVISSQFGLTRWTVRQGGLDFQKMQSSELKRGDTKQADQLLTLIHMEPIGSTHSSVDIPSTHIMEELAF